MNVNASNAFAQAAWGHLVKRQIEVLCFRASVARAFINQQQRAKSSLLTMQRNHHKVIDLKIFILRKPRNSTKTQFSFSFVRMKRAQFGSIIREYRLKKNWTQAQLADALGYETPQFISLIERDQSKVPVNVLGQLIILLGIPEDEVIKRLVKSFQDEILTQINKGKKIASGRP